METKLFLVIAARIILMCVIGMLFTFVPDLLRDFFGDSKCTFVNMDYSVRWYSHGGVISRACDGPFDEGWDWGIRHYWYAWMTGLLLMLSVVDSVVFAFKAVLRFYPELRL